ncbi:unnamed protein product [Coffea canephora]|uniref:Uncharacterized protein n=1 Tax=Coffea canephora TaxID=49390 RepID=A0A068UIF8_COFCA|nr:unnamed protein product [Coffea canephora]
MMTLGVHRNDLKKLVFYLHFHSIHSDGILSPTKLVERAHQNGVVRKHILIREKTGRVYCDYQFLILESINGAKLIGKLSKHSEKHTAQLRFCEISVVYIWTASTVKVIALTDDDTMSGIPEAQEAAFRFGIKIIPRVEVSTVFCPRETGSEEPVHVLAYYSVCGPSRIEESVKLILGTRNGCFLSAKSIVSKLNKLKLSLKWEHMTKIAGTGVAPERLHVACALVEAGHVENLRLAFSRYLYDGGPAYSRESEQNAEEAVELIFEAGGVAVLAHPWALKSQVAVIRRLTKPGLHGIDTCRSDGKLAVYCDCADAYGLVKLGGSDYRGRGGQHESDVCVGRGGGECEPSHVIGA